jgi:hypothetical protein
MALRRVRLLIAAAMSIPVLGTTLLHGAPAVTIAFTASSNVSLHEPVLARMTITNASGAPVAIDYGADRLDNFSVTHTTPDGQRRTSKLTLYDPNQMEVLQEVVVDRELNAGATYAQYVVLSKNLDFSAIGAHRVTIDFTGAITDRHGGTIDVDGRQGTVTIDVEPYDAARLARACGAIADRLLVGYPLDARIQATALAYVPDPAVRPFLQRLVDARREESIAAQGLKRLEAAGGGGSRP